MAATIVNAPNIIWIGAGRRPRLNRKYPASRAPARSTRIDRAAGTPEAQVLPGETISCLLRPRQSNTAGSMKLEEVPVKISISVIALAAVLAIGLASPGSAHEETAGKLKIGHP
jgi:hypothetical protein